MVLKGGKRRERKGKGKKEEEKRGKKKKKTKPYIDDRGVHYQK
jgi:hypothetical protein